VLSIGARGVDKELACRNELRSTMLQLHVVELVLPDTQHGYRNLGLDLHVDDLMPS